MNKNKTTDFSWRLLQDTVADKLAADLFNIQNLLKKIRMSPGKEVAIVIYTDRIGFEEREGDSYVRSISRDTFVTVRKVFSMIKGKNY